MSSTHKIIWSPKDLTIFWPLHAMPKSLPAMCRNRTFIRSRDRSNGLEIVEETKYQSIIRSIPDHYGNFLSIINSRIMHLQACEAYLKSLQSDEHRQTLEYRQTLERLQDSCRRNLIFTCAIRGEFYEEVAHAFYGKGGVPSRKFSQQDFSFRSTNLDSWLHVEFYNGTHAPPTYETQSNITRVQKHPKDITREGVSFCPCGVRLVSCDSRLVGLGQA
jgi:hypothetical protein